MIDDRRSMEEVGEELADGGWLWAEEVEELAVGGWLWAVDEEVEG
jgi:hypothetical protein